MSLDTPVELAADIEARARARAKEQHGKPEAGAVPSFDVTLRIRRYNPEVDIAGLKERYLRVGVSDRGARYNTELLEAVELGFLLDLAEVIVVGALERKESRGGHFREDYAHRDDVNYMRHTMAYRVPTDDGRPAGVRLDYKPVVQTRYEPMERKY